MLEELWISIEWEDGGPVWRVERQSPCNVLGRSCFTQSEVSLAGLGRMGCTLMGKSDHENPKFVPLLDTFSPAGL